MTDEMIFAVEGAVGRIRLNRPKAIHALNTAMCDAMIERLLAWRADPAIRMVMIDHAEGRGFCAGGDIRMIAESGATDGVGARDFFFREYRLNHLLFTYAKPVIAFMDGITMGGGVGISQPAAYRIATERTVYAMPESGIGLFPDVGGGWYLSRLPGRTGQFLALTGARIDGAECVALGLATHYVPSDGLDALKAAIAADPGEVDQILAGFAVPPPPARIAGNRERIDRLFAPETLEGVIAALQADGSEWAEKELATLATKSPTTCKVSLRLLAQGRDHADFADEMRVEYRVASHICQRHDFIEGVRALIIDKDNAPRWDPATPEGVSDHVIDQIFAPLPENQEWTPVPL
ncbi:enoyl-CoA hydratase/isomerase family protein [Edaphosphingomonas haloaromaticamans]|uniref:3-hydroxyisobutyryl-CoA hydrolase n=1 Tax=Edaphosphingomonas haloaromaticamans TaxID=653954 RepID=A0A1S1H908_9SPHN|nr:enoyl-CoA hydratase/isomerase family protein [Sphingomonas haloaromaticamans]OHT18614.1 Carnitinyl-CoA dehydratase [Sphingomonas haloaromaticamans]